MAHGMASNGAEFQWICKVLGDSRQAICGKHPAESWISKDAGWIILTLLQAPISPKEIKHKRPSGMYLLHSHDGCSLTLLMDLSILSSVINEKKHTKLFFAFSSQPPFNQPSKSNLKRLCLYRHPLIPKKCPATSDDWQRLAKSKTCRDHVTGRTGRSPSEDII